MSRSKSIDQLADDPLIQQCEQRIALSVSLVGDLLLDVFDVQDPETQPGAIEDLSQTSPDLLEQAADLRADIGLDGRGQTAVVIDSGIAWNHVALGGGFGPGYRVVGGWDFAENDADPYDDGPAGYHGSHVAGLLAGNSADFAGVAPEADLVGLRVFDDQGAGKLQWIESALQWVHDNQHTFNSPITTVNLSVGTLLTGENQTEAQSMLADELQQLREDQILVFAAAGNLFDKVGGDGVLFPASDPLVVAITSAGSDGQLSDFAQREGGILATRGESISSAVPEHVFGWDGDYNDFTSLDGSSMAAPQAAAASMLIRQSLIEQGLQPTAEDVLRRLHDSAVTQIDPVTGQTFDTIDLARAVAVESGTSANEVEVTDQFIGGNDEEHAQLDLRDGIKLSVAGRNLDLQPNQFGDPLLIDVGGGADSLRIIGSENVERLTAKSDAPSELSTNDYTIQLRGFENVSFEGGGGRDRATLYDSTSDDTLQSSPGKASLAGAGFRFDVINVPRVYVHATGGGFDAAQLNDSAVDDMLAVRPQFTSLRNDQTIQLAYGFERVYAYATAGGNDSAEIYDSEDDDLLSVSAARSMITGEDYQVRAKGFGSIVAHATAGGHDIASFYSSETSTSWHATSDMVQWTGQDAVTRVARGFERVDAFEHYQPVDLRAFAIGDLYWSDDDDDESMNEADAMRAVFDDLGAQA